MTNRKQFKLIGVRPLKGCAPNLRKILKEDTTYFLYNNYQEDSNEPEQVQLTSDVSVIEDLYYQAKENTPLISVSAIVGKNGDGKSTLIELIMRILNNFAYASGFIKNQESLKPVKGLHAILYYSIGEQIHYIKSKGDYITTSFLGQKTLNIKKRNENIISNKDQFELNFFYTQISNYSFYAYNSNELKHENEEIGGCWINGIFHKNDAYQTPIVLHPWRDTGNMDINRENFLSIQRLTSLFVDSDESENSIRNLGNKQIAKYLTLQLYEKSKLELSTYENYFHEAIRYNNALLGTHVIDLEEEGKFLSNYNIVKGPHLNTLKGLKRLIEDNKSDFDFALSIAPNTNIETVEEDGKEINRIINSDFQHYLDTLEQTARKFSKNQNVNPNEIISICNYFTSNNYSVFSISQLQRIILVVSIRHLWNENDKVGYKDIYGNDQISKAKQYIIYKTISIFRKYPHYKKIEKVSTFDDTNLIFNFSTDLNAYIKGQKQCFSKLLKEIDEEKSHITLKLRQTLNYIRIGCKKYKQEVKDQKLISSLCELNEDFQDNLLVFGFQDIKTIIEEIQSEKKTEIDSIEYLPPPIFNTDIVFQQLDINQEHSLLSALSSGERQLLNSTSSVIYHLQNLNSVSSQELVKYRHINLIFEEIELYFHPEYQRQYIHKLITLINKAHINNIESINMCFVTHSPFILSDILVSNILRLNKGELYQHLDPDKNTFGANIHDLLADSFFLNNGFMGEYAQNKIEETILFINFKKFENDLTQLQDEIRDCTDKEQLIILKKEYNNILKQKQEIRLKDITQNIEYHKRIIDSIGEPIIKNKLLDMLSGAFPKARKRELVINRIKQIMKLEGIDLDSLKN